MPDNSAAIARIEKLLNSGATKMNVDGQMVEVDPEALRRRLRELQESDTNNPLASQRLKSIDLSNAF